MTDLENIFGDDSEEEVIDVVENSNGYDEELETEDTGKKSLTSKSKEEQKIVYLKRALKEKEQRIKELENGSKASEETSKLIESYLAKGYDEDTAKNFATTESKMTAIQERLELQEFKEQNASILGKYPKASEDLKWLMNASKTTGMSVEEICRGRFANDLQTKEQRQKDAMLTPSGSQSNPVTTAMRGAESEESLSLNAKDERTKEFFENLFGEKLSTKDFLALKERRGL